jgi:thioredoxin 1
MKKTAIILLIILLGIGLFESPAKAKAEKPLITFIELGSVNCIPCKKMQPVMKSIEKKYGSQIEVIFYDVWKDEFKSKVEEYKIKLIPTQVFLDQNGKEIDRHEGFYPEEQMDKFLQSKGLKIKKGKKK